MLNAIAIGKKIEMARKNNQLSQTLLAQKLNITPQAVGKWERGESMPDIIMFDRIASVLGVDMNYFSDNTKIEESESIRTEVQITGIAEQKVTWNMSGASWLDADFSGLKNLGVKFSGANIKRCIFLSSDMSCLKLAGNHITKNDFSNSIFNKSKIKGAHVTDNKFSGCQFVDTLFQGSHVHNCEYNDADFTGALFKGCIMRKCAIKNAVFKKTRFIGTQLSDMVFEGEIADCSFENCSFTRVIFQNVVFTNTFFKGRVKKITFINCKADNLSYAFLKNGKADMSDIALITFNE